MILHTFNIPQDYSILANLYCRTKKPSLVSNPMRLYTGHTLCKEVLLKLCTALGHYTDLSLYQCKQSACCIMKNKSLISYKFDTCIMGCSDKCAQTSSCWLCNFICPISYYISTRSETKCMLSSQLSSQLSSPN